MSEDDSFASAMQGEGVSPLKKSPAKVNLKGSIQNANQDAGDNCPDISHKRKRAESHTASATPLSETLITEYGPHDILEFKRHGIQHGTFKNLKQGNISVEDELDLHRHTVEKARQALWQFIKQAQARQSRCVLIQHGKGYHSGSHAAPHDERGEPASKTVSVLKSHVAHWLQQFESVLAYSSTAPRDGGTGAVYVLLKKSN